MSWCSKHAPAKPGLCSVHGLEFEELHDKEIERKFGVEALFYCSVLGCREFSPDIVSRHEPNECHIEKTFLEDAWNLTLWSPQKLQLCIAIQGIFENAALLAILFHKQSGAVDDGR